MNQAFNLAQVCILKEDIKKKIVDAKVHRFECTRELHLADLAVKDLEKHLEEKKKREKVGKAYRAQSAYRQGKARDMANTSSSTGGEEFVCLFVGLV